MPYVPTNRDDEDENKNEATISGTDATGDVGSGQQGGFLSPQQSGTSGWTDVKAYLDANKDQANSTAKNIGGKLSGEADELKNTIGQGEKDFEKSVDQKKIGYDEGTVNAALANPADFAKDDANLEKFTTMRDASYGGPSSLFDTNAYGDLSNKIAEGVRRGNLTDTEGGREQLLFETGNNPTKGQVTLDSLLISGSPETRDVLKQGAAKFGTLQSYLDEQNAAASDYANSAKAETEATSSKTKAALNKAIPEFQGDLDARVAAARVAAAQRTKAAEALLSDVRQSNSPRDAQGLADLGVTDADLNKIGAGRDILDVYRGMTDPITGESYFSDDFYPSQYATERNPENEITRSNFATADDYAKAAALAKLSGQDMTGFLNPADVANAGKASLDTIDFDNTAAQNSVSGLVKDRDTYLAKTALGIDLANPKDADAKIKSLQGYFDNVMNGKIIPYDNPQDPRSIRMVNAIKALVRQGVYTPTPAYTGPGGTPSVGPIYGGSFVDPTTGRTVS